MSKSPLIGVGESTINDVYQTDSVLVSLLFKTGASSRRTLEP